MQRASKNLSFVLIPMVIFSVALGFGGMISSTESPIIPESITEEVLAEAPVEEPVVEVPEVVEITTPDPVVEEIVVDEVVIEEPVVEEPVVFRQSIVPPLPADEDGWIVVFDGGRDPVLSYLIVQSFWTERGWEAFDTVWELVLGDPIPPEIYTDGVAVPILKPTSEPFIENDAIDYKLTIDALNGGPQQEETIPQPIPLEWIYDAPQIAFDVDPVNGIYEPPQITVLNVGELDLFVQTIELETIVPETPGKSNYEPAETIPGGSPGWVIPADWLRTGVGTHRVYFYTNDPDAQPWVTILYDIVAEVVAFVEITNEDMDVGIGSERFGVTIDYETLGVDFTVTAWLEDADGNPASAVETIDGLNGAGSKVIALKVLFVDAGTDYQYRVVCDDVDLDETIAGVSLNHWSDFKKLRNAGTDWKATVRWDAVPLEGDFSVYVSLRYWDADKQELWDVFDSTDNQVIASEDLADGEGPELADGEAEILLAKPDSKNWGESGPDGTIPVANGEVWMNTYNSGYYFFTFMAPNSPDSNPWADRIGCPPEGL